MLQTTETKTMSSTEIAALVEKEHKNVIRDIRVQILEGLYNVKDGSDLSHDEIQGVTVKTDARGYTSEILLDKEHTLTLITGYDVKKRHAINKRWLELEGFSNSASQPDFDKAKQTGLLSPAYVEMAKAFGFEGNQAYISADKAIRQITGYSPLALLGAELTSPVQAPALVPSDIAERLGLTKQEPNKLLTAKGFQTSHRDHKSRIYYELTEKGKQYGQYVDTGLKHSDGSPRKQIKWFSTILDVLTIGE